MLIARALRSSFVTVTGATLMVGLMGGVSGVIAAHALGPYQRGLLATAVVWSTVLGSLGAYGLPQASTFFVARETERRASFAATMLLLAVGIGAALAVVGGAASLMLIPGRASAPLAIAFAGMLPNLVAGFAVGAILGLGEFRSWGLFRMLGPALALLGVVIVIAAGWHTAVAIACVYSAVYAIQAVVTLFGLRRRSLIGSPSRALVGPITSYMWRNVVSGAAWLISLRLDQLFLSLAVAPSSLGIYAVSASFGEIMVPVAGSAGSVMLNRVASGGAPAIRASLSRALSVCLLVAGGYAAVTFFVAPFAVKLLFGPRYLPGVASLRILLVGAVSLALASVLADTLRGLGKPLVPARAEVFGALTTLVLLFALVPSLGIRGAAVTSTTSYTLVLILMARNLRAELRTSVVTPSPT